MLKKNTKQMILCAIFAALVSVGAFIRIPMPYFDYITLQTMFVLLSGMLLGAKYGSASVFLYIIIGLLGVPVFAGGGGVDYILRPSFGFLIGFAAAAAVIGTVVKRKKSFWAFLFAGLIGLTIIYGCGIFYRYLIMNYFMGTPISLKLIFLACLPVEIPKDILICIFTSWLAARLSRSFGRII